MMLQTIRLEHVLRETVRTPYRDLVTRPTGAAVRTSIQQAIASTNCGTTLLDFSEIGLVDFSCADEVVAKLLIDIGRARGPYVVLSGMREDHTEAIEHVLDHHALAVVAADPERGQPRVLGRLDPEPRLLFARLHELEAQTADALAAALGWTVEHTRDALEDLARLRLIHADGDRFVPLPIP